MDATLPFPLNAASAAENTVFHICIVTETYPPEVNGVAHTLEHLVEGLRTGGHSVHVVRPRQTGEVEGDDDTTLVPGIGLPVYKELQLGLPARRTLRHLWNRNRPDIVYIATEGPLGWSAMREARFHHIPAISGFHTNFHTYSRHYRLGPLKPLVFQYLRYFHNRTVCTLAPSPELVAKLRRERFHSVEQMARGVDIESFSPQHRRIERRREWAMDDTDLGVLYVGRIAAEKNLSLAERAYRSIQRRYSRARFILVGDGPLRPTLERDNPDFVFCGMQRGSALAERYASADLLLFPSMTETFGNVVLEAMASGLPVLAYDYAAASMHIRSDHNGVTVPFGDEAGYLAGAERLARPPAEQRPMGAAARTTVEALGWDSIVQRFENLIWEYLDNEEVEHEYA